MNYYVVLTEWCVDYESGLGVLGVFTSKQEAIDAMRERVNSDERLLAEEYGYEIYEDSETCFDAGEEGYYVPNHMVVRIIDQPGLILQGNR